MKNPVQPIVEVNGTLRFKENAIVNTLYEFSKGKGMGLNEIACMKFSDDDRRQFAQLIGYSLCGYGELGYVRDCDYETAVIMSEIKDEKDARLEYLENELKRLKELLKEPVSKLYGIHPDDLEGGII